MDPNQLVDAACPKIKDLGWAFYFTPETLSAGKELGLDGLRFYVLGRGGVLGDVDSEVVASSFGYFAPALVARMWDSAKSFAAPREAAQAYMQCSAQLGRARFGDVPDLQSFCDAAGAVNDAADPVGLALYSGIRAMSLVDDLPGRAMQLMTVLREFRGSAHLVAVRASGLDAKSAHFMDRPSDMEMFGWTDNDTPVVTDDHRSRLEAANRLTDELVLPAYSALDDQQATALLVGLEAFSAALNG